MKRNFHIYRRLIGVQLRSQLHYRWQFTVDSLTTFIVTALEFSALALVFQKFSSIEGWSLAEVAFLYGMVEMAFGIMDMTFSGFDPPYFGRFIRKGSFDQMMLRPVNLTTQVLGSDFGLKRIGKIMVGASIFSFAILNTDITWSIDKLLYLPIVLLSLVMFFGALFIIGATITFWTVNSIEVLNIFTYGGTYMMSYPMHIYQNNLRRFFTYVMPAIFLNYYPALYFLNKDDPFGFPSFAPFIAPFVALGVFLLALSFWRFGISKYQSTGT